MDTPEITFNRQPLNIQDEPITVRELFSLCLGKWHWFVMSLLIILGLAEAYLLTTPPMFTRYASLLIKEDGKGNKNLSSELKSDVELGLFTSNTNVSNELISLQSPDLIMDVVSRLGIDVDYKTDGTFHKETLYGQNLPFRVKFHDLAYNDRCKFTAIVLDAGRLLLSDFILNDTEYNDTTYIAHRGRELRTPLGRITISAPDNSQSLTEGSHIYVSRNALMSAVSSCKSRMEVKLNDEKSTIVDITYKDVNSQRADDFLRMLISAYNENWVKDKNRIAVSTSEFINERLNVIEQELGHVDSDISSYKSANLVPNVETASDMYMNTANQASIQITDLNNQLYMARYVREHVRTKNSKDQLLPANSGINSPAIEQQISDYNEKMLQRNSLVQYSSDKNPLVVDLDKKLAEMRDAIVSSIDNQVNTLNTQISGLRSIQGASTSRIASNPSQAKYLLSVERQQKVKEALYLFLLQKREENELSQAFTAYNTRIVTSPTASTSSSDLLRRNILLLAVVLGLFFPMLTVFLKETLNTKVRGKRDIRQLSVPFIGEIPLYKQKRKRKKSNEDYKILVKPRSRNLINEAFRVVRTNMEFMAGTDKNRVIMVTSANPGSGKTFLTMNIATSYAIKEKRVIAVDLDMRRASLSEYVGKPQTGIADYLGGRIEDWHQITVAVEEHDHISLIPVGTIPPNPVELLFSERLQQLLGELRQEFDMVFLDCPPVDIVADASVISRWADLTVFVIRTGLMDRDLLPVVEGFYREKRFTNMSILLNGTPMDVTRYGSHRYGYGYGYGYGGYTKDE